MVERRRAADSKGQQPANADAAAAHSLPALRQRAEAALRELPTESSQPPAAMSPEEAQQALHELRLHQIALELQHAELQRTLAALDTAHARFADFYDTAPAGYCSVGNSGLVERANLATSALLGVTRDQLIKQAITGFIHPDDQGIYHRMRQRIQETGERHECELRMVKDDGTQVWVHKEAIIVQSERGAPVLRIVLSNITERKRMEEQVHQLAFFDPLTKLPNRRLLTDRMSQAMAASRRGGHYGALMVIDLDNFKPLNDTHGHAFGDLLLIEVAKRLTSCVREIDTVARFGGDEFVVLLNALDADAAESTAQCSIVAEKIRNLLSEPYQMTRSDEGQASITVEHRCTASIGVLVFVNHKVNQDEALRWADKAMYRAKAAGRNNIWFHDLTT